MLVEKVIAFINNGFETMDIRLQLMEEKIDLVNKLLMQMGAD